MKNLELEFSGVQSLSTHEMRSVEGGRFGWIFDVVMEVLSHLDDENVKYYENAYYGEPGGGRCHI